MLMIITEQFKTIPFSSIAPPLIAVPLVSLIPVSYTHLITCSPHKVSSDNCTKVLAKYLLQQKQSFIVPNSSYRQQFCHVFIVQSLQAYTGYTKR